MKEEGICAERGKNVIAIAATIPDPIESRLDHASDQHLAALVLAMENDRRSFVDKWLPWSVDRKTAEEARAGLAREYKPQGRDVEVQVAPPEAECHEWWPGVVLVSRNRGRDGGFERQTGILLVAGEVPTAGVRPKVLKRALRMAAALNEAPDKTVRLVGPTFSGSSGPMFDALLEETTSGGNVGHVDVWTGSATSKDNEIFKNRERISFHSTIVQDQEALQTFYKKFLIERGFVDGDATDAGSGLMPNVAILLEADTVYGQALYPTTQEYDAGVGLDGGGLRPKFLISYPIHISDVRSAWEKESSSLRESSAAGVPARKEAVRVDLQDRAEDVRDDLPTYSTMTAAYDERALASALGMLRENNVDVVGILATDTRDRLFLAEAVHRTAPDAQLFTYGSDILIAHPEYSHALHGSLVVTTYPLLAENDAWSGRFRVGIPQRRRQFGTGTSAGIFNAAVLAFRAAAHARCDRDNARMYQYHWPLFPGLNKEFDNRRRPPLWVTTVGNDGMWPVAVLDLDPQSDYLSDLSDTDCPPLPDGDRAEPATLDVNWSGVVPPPVHPPGELPAFQAPDFEPSHAVSFVLVLYFCAVVAFCYRIVQSGTVVPRFGNQASRPQPGAADDPDLVARRAAWVALAVLASLTVWLGAVGVASIEFRSLLRARGLSVDPLTYWSVLRVVAACLAVAACAFPVAHLAIARRRTPESGSVLKFPQVGFAVLAGIGAYPLMAWFARAAYAKDIVEGIPRYHRIIHPWSLVSPLLFVACSVAIALLALSSAFRIASIDRKMSRGLLSPAPGENGHGYWSAFGDLELTRTGLRKLYHPLSWWLPVLVLACGWTAVTARAHLDWPRSSLFGSLLFGLLAVVPLALCILAVRHLCEFWEILHGWLEDNDFAKLARGLAAVRDEATILVGQGTGMRVPDDLALARLQKSLEESGCATQEPAMTAAEGAPRSRPPEPTAVERFLALRFAFLVACGVSRLREIWWRLSLSSFLFVGALALYPVHPHKELLVLSWLLVGMVATATVWVFVQINRNAVLSVLAGTTPNEFNWNGDFVLKLVTVAGIPLLGVIAAAFPHFARIAGTILEPIFRGAH